MKKSFLTLLAIFVFCLTMTAQRSKKGKERTSERTEQADQSSRSQRSQAPMSLNPRAGRQIAIVSDSGLKSMTGLGISGSYYVTPNIAIDAGAGLGLFVLKAGVRGRYLFLDKKLSPYVGVGLFRNSSGPDGLVLPSADGFDEYAIDIAPSIFGQGIVGAEFMGDNGFVIGFHFGFSNNFNDTPWSSSDNIDVDSAEGYDIFYGSGLATGFRIGFAF